MVPRFYCFSIKKSLIRTLCPALDPEAVVHSRCAFSSKLRRLDIVVFINISRQSVSLFVRNTYLVINYRCCLDKLKLFLCT